MPVLALASREKVFPVEDYTYDCPNCGREYLIKETRWARENENQSTCPVCRLLDKRAKVKSPTARYLPCIWAEKRPIFPKK